MLRDEPGLRGPRFRAPKLQWAQPMEHSRVGQAKAVWGADGSGCACGSMSGRMRARRDRSAVAPSTCMAQLDHGVDLVAHVARNCRPGDQSRSAGEGLEIVADAGEHVG